MSTFVDKLRELELNLSKERGQFVLFALMQREDLPDRWDLVVSAPWIGENKKKFIDDLVSRISAQFGSEELVALSRIVVANPEEPAVKAFNQAFAGEHGAIEVANSVLFGLPVKHAIIVTSMAPQPAVGG